MLLINTEQIIEEVRLRPCIWNTNHERYKEREVKSQAWLEILYAVVDDAENLPKRRIKNIDKLIRQRWKTARDAYVRCRTTRRRDMLNKRPLKTKYMFYDNLSFLEAVSDPSFEYTFTYSETNQYDASQEAVAEDIQSEYENSENEEFSVKNETDLESECKYPTVVIKDCKSLLTELSTTNSSHLDEEETKNEEIIQQNGKANGDDTLEFDDMAFFTSFVPVFKKFDIMEKLRFRSEVLQNAIGIKEMANVRSPRYQTPQTPQIQECYSSKVP